MSTYINVTVGDGGLLDRVKGQQQASRFAFAEEQRRKEIEAAKAKAEASEKKDQERKLDPQPYKRDLTAHRHPTGGLASVAYRRTIESVGSFTLEVGLPGFSKSVLISGIDDPAQKTIGDISLPASGSQADDPMAYGGFHIYVADSALPYKVYSAEVGPALLYEGTVQPPLTSKSSTWDPYTTQTSTNKTRVYVLPVAPDACVLVYLHNKMKLIRVFTLRKSTNRITFNARAGTFTIYDQQVESTTEYEFVRNELFTAYEAYCVFVSPKRVARIATPDALMTALKKLSPPAKINGTKMQAEKSGGGQYNFFGPPYTDDRTSYLYTLPSTTQTVDTFDNNVWRASAAYEQYSANNLVLAQQFGLGYLNTGLHQGNFFTPAVYQYLSGSMNLAGSDSLSYAAMRSAYYSKAPSRFLAPCVQACNTDDTEFYVTTTQPNTITSVVPDSSFTKARGYAVKQGESSPGFVYYAWDWGDKAKCKAALLALGFSPADIGP